MLVNILGTAAVCFFVAGVLAVIFFPFAVLHAIKKLTKPEN